MVSNNFFTQTPKDQSSINSPNQYLFCHKFTSLAHSRVSPYTHTMEGQGEILTLCSYILVIFLLSLVAETSAKVPAVIVFGDSSVDAGNNNFIPTIARSNFQPYGRDFEGGKATGRFCNGRIPTDFISEAFGLKPYVPAYLDPKYNISDFASGVTFASAATGYDNATSAVLVTIHVFFKIVEVVYFFNNLCLFLGLHTVSVSLIFTFLNC